jgi:hypothetical protein
MCTDRLDGAVPSTGDGILRIPVSFAREGVDHRQHDGHLVREVAVGESVLDSGVSA